MLWLLCVAAVALLAGSAQAGPITCNADPAQCGWTISVDGVEVANGVFTIDADGNVTGPAEPVEVVGAGFTVTLSSVTGQVDPEIVFGLGATNTSNAPKTYAFSFSLPLGGFATPIATSASLGTTLTASTGSGPSGDTVFPVLGVNKIVDSQDIVFSPFASVDKGVDIGDPLTDPATLGPTLRSETAFGSILTGGPFDLMTVTVAFGLTDNDPGPAGAGVGFSGQVIQVVPEPSTALLLGFGLLGLASARSRRAR